MDQDANQSTVRFAVQVTRLFDFLFFVRTQEYYLGALSGPWRVGAESTKDEVDFLNPSAVMLVRGVHRQECMIFIRLEI